MMIRAMLHIPSLGYLVTQLTQNTATATVRVAPLAAAGYHMVMSLQSNKRRIDPLSTLITDGR